ncbi:Xaa-Pro aminopeptidase [Actinomycetaceae bacterium MB13-C1-2]|nr:Xaa-Pro aminopeptidase [Actinomycetaceae bacterium MB13-C1-2]
MSETTETNSSEQSIDSRGDNRSHRPSGKAFREFMASNWGERPPLDLDPTGTADYVPARHEAIGKLFPGERLVVPAGNLKTRSNDTDYRFRAHSAFAHMTGLGAELEPDAVFVLHPLTESEKTHEAVLYFTPRSSRTSEEFYADSRYGEFWVGARPSLEEMETATGIKCAAIDTLRDALAKDAGQVQLRVLPQVDTNVSAMVEEIREQAGLPTGEMALDRDELLVEKLSEIRLCKDEFEVQQMQKAVDATMRGFEEIIRSLPRAANHPRGERVIEGAFAAVAREDGNGLGYETIAAGGNHANTLHWMDNSGTVPADGLVLVDAGVEVDSLYTADITRTLPVNGKFTEAQAKIYQAVLDAAEAALARAAEPGVKFRNLHEAAQEVLAARLEEWGVLPVPAEESLKKEGQQHRRWMPHGTSHHLGLDVHDCAQARQEMYQDALLEPGMTFTIEPGLYFRADDLSVPAEMRGIGCRIEDDILIETDGTPRRMSEAIPRTIADVEAWIERVQRG